MKVYLKVETTWDGIVKIFSGTSSYATAKIWKDKIRGMQKSYNDTFNKVLVSYEESPEVKKKQIDDILECREMAANVFKHAFPDCDLNACYDIVEVEIEDG